MIPLILLIILCWFLFGPGAALGLLEGLLLLVALYWVVVGSVLLVGLVRHYRSND